MPTSPPCPMPTHIYTFFDMTTIKVTLLKASVQVIVPELVKVMLLVLMLMEVVGAMEVVKMAPLISMSGKVVELMELLDVRMTMVLLVNGVRRIYSDSNLTYYVFLYLSCVWIRVVLVWFMCNIM